jgi:TRAP-type C4-dicarboxylate transport system substrate-binding protein
VITNVTLTGHIQLVTALVVSADSWDEISAENQAKIRELAVENGRYASNLSIEQGEEAMKEVAASGVTVSEVDLAPFKEAVSGVYSMLNLDNEVAIVKAVLAK